MATTIVLTAGGSGGHLTPVLSVAAELRRLQPDARLVYIGQKGDRLGDIVAEKGVFDDTHHIYAGKFRRYHGEGWRQLLDIKTLLLNIRDLFRFVVGCWQSYWLLGRLKPQAVFTRGGYVSVPVGFAAHWRHIPYITHDSDAIPSLASRLIAKHAALHAVALPKETYNYPQDKTVQVGVPLAKEFVAVSPTLQKRYKADLNLPRDSQVICITGGGLGAQRLNDAVFKLSKQLLNEFPELYLLHITGRANESTAKTAYTNILPESSLKRVGVFGFVTDFYRYSGAADVVITRAGATNLAEFALQHRACIVVPNPYLSEGHQLKNAMALKKTGAVVVVQESNTMSEELLQSTRHLLSSTEKRKQLEGRIADFGVPDATARTAELVLQVAGNRAVQA